MANVVPQPEGHRVVAFARRKFSQFSLQHNVYCVPVDQSEQDRHKQLDEILHQVLQNGTVLAPATITPDASILDCGCGQGDWIERFKDEFDERPEVTGVDIHHFQRPPDEDDDDDDDEEEDDDDVVQEYFKKRWNLNAPFRDDRSADRLRPETFDLINSRLLSEGINAIRWDPPNPNASSFVTDLRRMLKPGGWLQMVEVQLHIQSSNGRLSDSSYLTQWWRRYSTVMERMGKNPRIGPRLGQLLQRERFTRITARSIDVPIGDWREGQESIGEENLPVVSNMLLSLSLWPFLTVDNMPPDEYRALIAGARAELQDTSKKLYYKVYIAYGQRRRQ